MKTMTERHARILAVTLAGALVLAACGTGTGSGSNVQNLRAAAGIAATPQASPLTATPAPLPTETPDFGDAPPAQIAPPATLRQAQGVAPQPVVIEVTRQVVDVQQVEVTRIVAVTTTPPPAPTAGIDENVQPCPVKFWKRGRCTATQAQLEQAANEVRP